MTLDEWFDRMEGEDAHLVGLGPGGQGLLDRSGSDEQTEDFASFHPAVRILDCVVLSDPNTSNHHLLIRHPIAAGMIALLSHEGDSRIVFDSLESFLVAARTAAIDDIHIEDMGSEEGLDVYDPLALERLLASIEDEDDRDQVRFVLVPEPFIRAG